MPIYMEVLYIQETRRFIIMPFKGEADDPILNSLYLWKANNDDDDSYSALLLKESYMLLKSFWMYREIYPERLVL